MDRIGKNIKLVILAAGQGTRLAPLTNEIPKCLVKLKDKPLVEWQLQVARKLGIKDIILIRGYKGEKLEYLKEFGVKLIDNFEYESTNMVETLFKAEEYFNSEFIISYGDIVFEETVLKAIIESNYDISVVIDHEWEKYWRMRVEDIFSDAESLVVDNNGIIKNIGQKVKDIEYIQGQYIGLLKFKNRGVENLKSIYNREKEAFLKDESYICKDKNLKKIYMTDVIQGLINENNKVYEVPIRGKWVEIDNVHDLKVANNLTENYKNVLVIRKN